jgi:hypothetical protein
MEAQEKTILTYVKADGSAPFNDWLENLKDRKARAIVRTRINRIRLGNLGDCKSVGEGGARTENKIWCWLPSLFWARRRHHHHFVIWW